jgi:hypothetical protein
MGKRRGKYKGKKVPKISDRKTSVANPVLLVLNPSGT